MKQNKTSGNFFTAMIKASDRLLWRILFAQMKQSYQIFLQDGTGND